MSESTSILNTPIRRRSVALAAISLLAPVFSGAAITAPTQISGLRLWLDADDPASLTVSGGKVSAWNDKSGAGNSITQADPNIQPSYASSNGPKNGGEVLFGLNNIATGIGDQFVSNTSGNVQDNFTAFFLVRPTKTIVPPVKTTSGAPGTSGQAYVWAPDFISSGTGRGAGLSLGVNAAGVYEHTDGTLFPSSAATTPIVGYHVLAVRYAGKQPSLYLDGALLDTGTVSGGVAVFASKQFGDVGSGGPSTGFGFFQGGLNEAIVYNSALALGAGGDFESVNNYLAAQAPEPGTIALLAVAGVPLLARRRRRAAR